MFSRRTDWSLAPNRLAAALEAKRRSGSRILDLTLSNPTRAGFDYPQEAIAAALAEGTRHPYDPQPKGDLAAREAVAGWYASRGLPVEPGRIVLTASTSEAYAWMFKLLCEPGDHVLVPRPSYPLFEFLAALESVRAAAYPLRYETRWELDFEALRAALPGETRGESRARAIVVVNPNNPTGSFLDRAELARLGSIALEQDLPLVCDEVFSTYTLEGPERLVPSLLGNDDVPGFVLDGLSKSAGLPGIKAGWIVVCGPAAFREPALARLEVVADTYLSVGSPVQKALPRLIELGSAVNRQVLARIRANHRTLRDALASGSACEALRAEGGWSAVLRIPRTHPEEEWCLRLLEEDGVLAQPGWFFDFESEAYLVLSLLAPEAEFGEGLARILRRAG